MNAPTIRCRACGQQVSANIAASDFTCPSSPAAPEVTGGAVKFDMVAWERLPVAVPRFRELTIGAPMAVAFVPDESMKARRRR